MIGNCNPLNSNHDCMTGAKNSRRINKRFVCPKCFSLLKKRMVWLMMVHIDLTENLAVKSAVSRNGGAEPHISCSMFRTPVSV